MRILVPLVLMLLSCFPAISGEDYVAQLAIRDTAGDVKIQLYRTSKSECEKHLDSMANIAEGTPGVIEVFSVKCGPGLGLEAYFHGIPLGVPYIHFDTTNVLILQGASDAACVGMEILLHTLGTNDAECVLPKSSATALR